MNISKTFFACHYYASTNTFFCRFSNTFAISLYVNPVNDIGLKSASFNGFFLFGISTINDLFTPTNHTAVCMKFSHYSNEVFFNYILKFFHKTKIHPSRPGIFTMSYSRTALRTSSFENSWTISCFSVLLIFLNSMLAEIGFTPLAENQFWKWRAFSSFIPPHTL